EQPGEWFLDWLIQLQPDSRDSTDLQRRIESYRGRNDDECRRGFVSALQRAAPESVRTPLVLFRLAPVAVRIVVASAFSDTKRAKQLRAQQHEILPASGFSNDGRGRLVAIGVECPRCGTPVWSFGWLRES